MAYGDLKVRNLIWNTGSGDNTVVLSTLLTGSSPNWTGTATGVNLTLSGDLQVNGTTTTINTQTLDVEDHNITLGKVTTPSDTTANNGGITLKGASDKTFNWVNATDAWTSSEHLHLLDDKKLLLGTSSECTFFHDNAGHTYLTTSTGNFHIQCPAGENSIRAIPDGAVELYHNNAKKLETASYGVAITGHCDVNGGDLVIEDNQKARFGNGYDLEIYHDGTHNYIQSTNGRTHLTGVGRVQIQTNNGSTTENSIVTYSDGAVHLYYDNSVKFETTSSGIKLSDTGPVLTVNASNNQSGLRVNVLGQSSGELFRVQDDGSTKFTINENGKVGISATPSNYLLQIPAGEEIGFHNGSSNYGYFEPYSTAGNMEFNINWGGGSGESIIFKTRDIERFRFDDTGGLGIAGANYGTSGQVLTSGGSGSAPGWTTISGAPQITGTASGAIAANKPVIVHTDGTLKEVTQTVTARSSALVGAQDVFKSQTLNSVHSDWDPNSQTTVVLYRNLQFGQNPGIGRIQAIKHTAAGSAPTNGAQLDISWGANCHVYDLRYDPTSECMLALFNYNSESFFCSFTISGNDGTTESHDQIKAGATSSGQLCPCPAAGKLFVFNAVGNRTEGWAYTNVGTGTSLSSWTHGSGVYLNGSSTGNEGYVRAAYHSDSGKVVVIYRDNNDSDRLKSRVVSYDSSNNRLTFANSNDITTSSTDDTALEYDPNSNKLIAAYRRSSTLYFKIGTLSGTSISWGTERTFQANARYPKVRYTSIGHQIFISYADSSNRWSYKYGVISGTDITIGTNAQGYLNSSANDHDDHGGLVFNTSIAAIVGSNVMFNNGNNGQTRTAVLSDAVSNLTTGFAGFSDAAYSNGATATINVTGNTTTQSGLTAGTNYFVQNDGSLGTSAASAATVEAGLALSSTKLLIKG